MPCSGSADPKRWLRNPAQAKRLMFSHSFQAFCHCWIIVWTCEGFREIVSIERKIGQVMAVMASQQPWASDPKLETMVCDSWASALISLELMTDLGLLILYSLTHPPPAHLNGGDGCSLLLLCSMLFSWLPQTLRPLSKFFSRVDMSGLCKLSASA